MTSYVELFEKNGYAVVEDVFNETEIQDMKREISKIVDAFDFETIPKSVFSTEEEDKHAKDDYFVESGSQVRAFFEEGSLDNKGSLTVPKQLALNKIGHALHWLNPVFKNYSFHPRIKEIVSQLGFEDPKIVQSMYIFKQPRIGGSVNEHIDASFLRAEPVDKLIAIWIALDDATELNGCLHFAPGSHKKPTTDYRFVRTYKEGGPLVEFRGNKPDYSGHSFVPVPVRKGA